MYELKIYSNPRVDLTCSILVLESFALSFCCEISSCCITWVQRKVALPVVLSQSLTSHITALILWKNIQPTICEESPSIL